MARGRVLLAVLCLLACDGGDESGRAGDVPTSTTARPTTATTAAPTTTTTAPYVPVAQHTAVISAWSPGSLDAGFVDAVPTLPGVVAATVVAGNRLMLVDGAPAGLAFPLDALAVDPATYPAFVPPEHQEPFARLGAGEAVLGETSAVLRGLEPGGTLELLGGERLTVTAVVPDVAVAGAELVVAARPGAPVSTPRFALVAHGGDVQGVAAALRDAFPAERPLRVRQPGEVPFLRHGDGVLTDAQVKATFGELAFAESPTRDFAAWDTAWTDAHIGRAPVAVIGAAECHREILPDLAAALAEVDALQQQLLADQAASTTTDPAAPPPAPPDPPILAPDANLGCWNPRLIQPGEGVSRHAYGTAIDLRPPATTGVHDPRLIAIFESHGFTWGGDFVAPDPIHFEWIG